MKSFAKLCERTLRCALSLAIVTSLVAVVFGSVAQAQVPSATPPSLQRSTYGAGAAFTYPATGAGDAACLVGSATKIVRLVRVRVSGTDATAQSATMNVVKRTVANTGGTATQPSIALMDSANAAATAVVNAYTVIPTPGAGVTVSSDTVNLLAATTATSIFEKSFIPQETISQQPTLRGVAQSLCVNFPNALTTNPAALTLSFEWTEQ